MIDRYKIIIWARSRDESLKEQVDCAYDILTKVKEYKLFDKLFLPARSKKEVKVFDIKRENIEKLILCKRDKIFANLGSQLAFFTSLDNKNSMYINFSVGISHPNFNNVMGIFLPVNFTSSQLIESIGLLKDLAKRYKAFYACFTSDMNSELYEDFYDFDNQIPKAAFWVNYWGKDIIKNIKINEELLETVYEYEVTEDGLYIRLQKEPINVLNNQHIELQNKINHILNI